MAFALLGIFVALVACYSFWLAVGVMQFVAMLAIIIIAFARSVRKSATSNYTVLVSEDNPEHPAEDQLA